MTKFSCAFRLTFTNSLPIFGEIVVYIYAIRLWTDHRITRSESNNEYFDSCPLCVVPGNSGRGKEDT